MSSDTTRILLIEDNPGDARLIRELLDEIQEGGFELQWVDRLAEAMRLLPDERFDLVLLDLSLPDSRGMETFRRVHEHSPDIPVVVFTGLDDDETAVATLQEGAQDYLVKGKIDADVLKRSLRHAIERHELLLELQKTRRRERVESEQVFHDLAEAALEGIVMTDAGGHITYLNKAAERMFRCPREEAVGLPLTNFLPSVAGRIGSWEDRCVRCGDDMIVGGSTSIIEGQSGAFFTHVLRDLTERKRFEKKLLYLANHDPLTGLLNRRRFQEKLDHFLAYARRHGGAGALLFLDLDQFKYVNDSLGHRAGDKFLASLGDLLREEVRTNHILARLGGDEFALFLPDVIGDEVEVLAEWLLEAVRRFTVTISGYPVTATTSIGIALYPAHGTSTKELLPRADMAMYQAKENGRNRYCIYEPGMARHTELESKLAWETRIREALDNDQFLLYAQPILDLRCDRISRYEVLLRMADENGGIILPRVFLGIAERFGLIQAIDRWVVRQAIELIATHQRSGRSICLEVNLSGKAFADSKLLPMIQREIAEKSIDPASLVLEITETAAIANISMAQHFISTLKNMGCRFALDDFGVGFSSFSVLKQLPVDYLKIDGDFIRNLHHNEVDQHLVKAMVEVAKSLGKETIAEFVETPEILRILREYEVDHAQGYHIGPPKPVNDALQCQTPDRQSAVDDDPTAN